MKHAIAGVLAGCATGGAGDSAGEPAPVSYSASGWTAMTLPELSAALAAGDLTSEGLTRAYLDRIAAVDRAGPRL